MTENEKESGDERTLITWAVGFMLVILAGVLTGEDSISLQELAAASIFLVIASIALRSLKTQLKRKKNETSFLAIQELT